MREFKRSMHIPSQFQTSQKYPHASCTSLNKSKSENPFYEKGYARRGHSNQQSRNAGCATTIKLILDYLLTTCNSVERLTSACQLILTCWQVCNSLVVDDLDRSWFLSGTCECMCLYGGILNIPYGFHILFWLASASFR